MTPLTSNKALNDRLRELLEDKLHYSHNMHAIAQEDTGNGFRFPSLSGNWLVFSSE